MIRPFTCLTVLLAAGSGLYLYSEKHRTTMLDERIRTVVEDTNRIEDRTSMLRAEWALLNQPDRLQTLAAKFLPKLQPMAPTQFVQAADLDSRLPPIGPPPEAPGGTIAPVPPGAGVAAPVSQTPPVIMASAGAAASHPKPVQPAAGAKPVTPVRVASAVVSHAPVVRVAAHVRRPDDLRSMVAAAWAAREAAASAREPAASLVRPVVSYARPAPVYAGAWRSVPVSSTPGTPVSSYAGSALGIAHEAMAPPMAAR